MNNLRPKVGDACWTFAGNKLMRGLISKELSHGDFVIKIDNEVLEVIRKDFEIFLCVEGGK